MASRRRRAPSRGTFVGLLGAVLLLLTGCGGVQSTLNTAGPAARRVSLLWWGLFGTAVVVWFVVTFLVIWGLVLRRGRDVKPRAGGEKFVIVAGIIIPTLILIGTFAGSVAVMRANAEPSKPTAMTITVVGHDWWWEVRYPHFVTANEIHIPLGEPVRVNLRTADVIHSFWVPSLTVKTDLIPNKSNSLWLQADRAGTFRGQCAEYCGLQHANMAFLVVAEPVTQFDQWVAAQAQPASTPDATLAAHGEQVFTQNSCASCHTVRGTSADGKVGPDLTHFGSRQKLGAGAAPNDPGWLSGWIANSQAVKPGNLMPPQPLAPGDLQAVTAYLEGLK